MHVLALKLIGDHQLSSGGPGFAGPVGEEFAALAGEDLGVVDQRSIITATTSSEEVSPQRPKGRFEVMMTEPCYLVDDDQLVAAAGVAGLSVGDEVYGLVPFDRDGAAAEYVSVPATSVAARPRTVSHVVAAAAVLPALTAWEAVVEHAAVQPGQRVLIHGGAGGVGSFATQLATALGASVTGTVHAPDVGYVLSLGAERVINTDQESLAAETGVFDVVIDAVGRDVPEALFAALRRGGRLIALQAPPSESLADKYGVTAVFFIVTAERDRLARIAGMIETDTLTVGVAATFPVAEGRAAYASGALRRSRPGKTVLIVRD